MTADCGQPDRRLRQLRELRVAVTGRKSWRILNVCVYTAHAVYLYSRAVGVVVGTSDGWWWGVQVGVRTVWPMCRALDVDDARRNAQRGAWLVNYQLSQEEVAPDGVAVGVRDNGGSGQRPAGSGPGGVRNADGASGPAYRSGARRAARGRGSALAA